MTVSPLDAEARGKTRRNSIPGGSTAASLLQTVFPLASSSLSLRYLTILVNSPLRQRLQSAEKSTKHSPHDYEWLHCTSMKLSVQFERSLF